MTNDSDSVNNSTYDGTRRKDSSVENETRNDFSPLHIRVAIYRKNDNAKQ